MPAHHLGGYPLANSGVQVSLSVGSMVIKPISQKMGDTRGLPEYSPSVDLSCVKSYGVITAMLIVFSFNIMNYFLLSMAPLLDSFIVNLFPLPVNQWLLNILVSPAS